MELFPSPISRISQMVVDADLNLAGYDLLCDEIKESTSSAGVKVFTLQTATLATASDVLRASFDAAEHTHSTSYIKVDEFTIPAGYAAGSVFRVKFDLYMGGASNTAYGRIYKNGSPHGTEQSQTNTTPVTKSEDLAFDPGDTCELWMKVSNASYEAYHQNFRIYCDNDYVQITCDDPSWS